MVFVFFVSHIIFSVSEIESVSDDGKSNDELFDHLEKAGNDDTYEPNNTPQLPKINIRETTKEINPNYSLNVGCDKTTKSVRSSMMGPQPLSWIQQKPKISDLNR